MCIRDRVSAFFGMITKYFEVFLAVEYRQKGKSGFYGGPMYYMEQGLHCKPLAWCFALLCLLASFGAGNFTQSYEAANALFNGFGVSPLITGTVCAALTFLLLSGGIRRISRFMQNLVPLLSVIYLAMAGVVPVSYTHRLQ